jgi:hypothetical protein
VQSLVLEGGAVGEVGNILLFGLGFLSQPVSGAQLLRA